MNKLSWSTTTISTLVFTLCSAQAYACSPNAYIGDVCYTAATFCPEGFFEAAGQSISINSQTALYSLLGSQYGGDDRTYFKLPDLSGRVPVGQGHGPGLSQKSQWIPYFGYEDIQLSSFHLPSHMHSINSTATLNGGQTYIPVDTNIGNQSMPSGAVHLAASTIGDAIYTSAAPSGTGAHIPVTIPAGAASLNAITGSAGANPNQAFEISQPSVVLRACINWDGTYPSRP